MGITRTFKNIGMDYRAYGMNPFRLIEGLFTLSNFYLVFLYRISYLAYIWGIPVLPNIIRGVGKVLYSADISPKAMIGGGFRVIHSQGVVIGDEVTAGDYLEIFQNTTIGGRNRELYGTSMPIILDCVSIFAGACVLGPIFIDNNSSIGANAVVTNHVEMGSVMAGIPAREIGTVKIPHAVTSMGYRTDMEYRKLLSKF